MPGAVNLGHFATPEPFLLLAAAGTLLAAARHADGRAPAWAVGLALGLAASTKYTAAALAVPCLLAVLLRRGEPRGPTCPPPPRWARSRCSQGPSCSPAPAPRSPPACASTTRGCSIPRARRRSWPGSAACWR